MASINIYSHDRINLATGLMQKVQGLFGNNAVQTVNVTRNTPLNPQQAVGYLGVVDYTRGAITSDVSIDTVMVQGCTNPVQTPVGTGATAISSILRYAAQTVDFTIESYAMTGFAMAMAAGSPTTCNYNYLCGTLSTYLTVQPAPQPQTGTLYAFVLGDMGLGLSLFPGWSASIPAPTVNPAGLPILQDSTGDLTTESDAGLPAGVQSVNIAGNINRDQVIDVRTTRPVGFITTYPLDITMDMEVYQVPQVYDLTTNAGPQPPTNPGASEWTYLTDLLVATSAYNPTAPDPTQVYAHITGLRKQTEGESVSVGRYLAYTIRFLGADIMMPIAAMPSPGSAT